MAFEEISSEIQICLRFLNVTISPDYAADKL